MSDVIINIQPTPNPNAFKFVLNKPVLSEGKASYSNAEEATGNQLATDLINIPGVKQIHFFSNVITATMRFDADVDELQQSITSVIHTRMNIHNPEFTKTDSVKAKRADLPEDVRKIEEILDRTIRPGLQGDGGDLAIIKYENNQLYVHYEGACGTCPSSTTGTLMAIEGILRDEFNPTIEVIPL